MKVKDKIIKKSEKLSHSSFKIIWNFKNPLSIEVYKDWGKKRGTLKN